MTIGGSIGLFFNIYRYTGFRQIGGIGAAFGYLALNLVYTLGNEEFYCMSHHQKPLSNVGSLWQSLDRPTWGCFILAIFLLSVLLTFINILVIRKADVTDILLRITLGSFRPEEIKWFKELKSFSLIIVTFGIITLSFNWFFNIDYRTALMVQTFPPNIESDEQIDIFHDGIFADYELRRAISMINLLLKVLQCSLDLTNSVLMNQFLTSNTPLIHKNFWI